jgi:hypothetical protein
MVKIGCCLAISLCHCPTCPGKSSKHRISAKGEGALYWMPAFLPSPKRSLIAGGLRFGFAQAGAGMTRRIGG